MAEVLVDIYRSTLKAISVMESQHEKRLQRENRASVCLGTIGRLDSAAPIMKSLHDFIWISSLMHRPVGGVAHSVICL